MPTTVAVVLPMFGAAKINCNLIEDVVANRIDTDGREQYLTRWRWTREPERQPLSWHTLFELSDCLELVQDYLQRRECRKRKASEIDLDSAFLSPPSKDRRVQDGTRSPSVVSSASESSRSGAYHVNDDIDAYNGILYQDDHEIKIRTAAERQIEIDSRLVPTPTMELISKSSSVNAARDRIRREFIRRLQSVKGERVSFINTRDKTTPSLKFRFINESVIGDGVYKADLDTVTGCQKCKPHMGQGMGCEYTKQCDCLEYAAPDRKRLSEEQIIRLERDRDTTGLPKNFPYQKFGPLRVLARRYLDDRFPIYECNSRCMCGPLCKTRLVQYGRTVKLEVFKTRDRGWGLRTREPLRRGQFIDTYLGEVITDEEATRREKAAEKSKESYFYTLDKFRDREELRAQEFYIVDGEHMGGPTRFVNHSCEPNCGQYAVSYNKHDWFVYELAFFAVRDIAANEELTFDYLDKDEADEEDADVGELRLSQTDGPAKERVRCRCGAPRCRKWLWM